jgi:ketosteroid isomerase-like protein
MTAAAAWASLPPAGDAAALEALVRADYDIFYRQRDERKYRALLTDDYLLLENGKIFDADGDVATMPKPGADYHRVDSFEFKKVRVSGDDAYVVYFLRSEITEKGASRNAAWLESVIARREKKRWRVALLHSTRFATS